MSGFRRLGEETAFSGSLFSVGQARFADPDGQLFARSIVHHPGAVAVVPVADDGTVTLVRQLRTAVWQELLEIPAGTRDVDGEPPEHTARRELAEEAGLEATDVRLLATVFNSPGFTDQQTLIFLATGLTACATTRHGVEERFMDVETVRLDDLPVLLAEGRLIDETTLLGLHLARHALAGGAG